MLASFLDHYVYRDVFNHVRKRSPAYDFVKSRYTVFTLARVFGEARSHMEKRFGGSLVTSLCIAVYSYVGANCAVVGRHILDLQCHVLSRLPDVTHLGASVVA
jgi:hypothetical protein